MEAVELDPVTAAEELSDIKKILQQLPMRQILWSLVLLLVLLVLVRVIMRLIGRALERTTLDKSLHTFIKSIVRILLYFLVVLVVSGSLGINVTSLVAVLSVASLAISLSVQGVLSNVASGLMIIGSKPFKQGEYVSLDGHEGTVDEIGLIYTRLHTIDNRNVLLPNSKVTDSVIQNFSILGKRRLEVFVSASYDSDPEAVFRALHKAVELTGPLEGEEVIVEFDEFGDSAISYQVCLWVKASDFLTARYQLRRNIYQCFKAEHVEMTYPHLNVHMKQ